MAGSCVIGSKRFGRRSLLSDKQFETYRVGASLLLSHHVSYVSSVWATLNLIPTISLDSQWCFSLVRLHQSTYYKVFRLRRKKALCHSR